MQVIHSNDVVPAPGLAKLQALLGSISEDQLREWIERISVPRHFVLEREANGRTGEWISSLLGHWGYEVELQGQCANIVALPANCPEEVVLVGAHYDSVPNCPGADDNASAVAGMLACAAACSLWRPAPSIAFVAFNREEDGFVGSRDFVVNYLPSAKYSIRCAHILEMIGYASSTPGSQRIPTGLPINLPTTGDFLGLLSNQNSAEVMSKVVRNARAYTAGLPVSGLEVIPGAELVFPVLARSDHAPFWSRGIPAVMWTDTAEFRNPHYHKATDTPETLNYGFLRSVAQLLTASVIIQQSNG